MQCVNQIDLVNAFVFRVVNGSKGVSKMFSDIGYYAPALVPAPQVHLISFGKFLYYFTCKVGGSKENIQLFLNYLVQQVVEKYDGSSFAREEQN